MTGKIRRTDKTFSAKSLADKYGEDVDKILDLLRELHKIHHVYIPATTPPNYYPERGILKETLLRSTKPKSDKEPPAILHKEVPRVQSNCTRCGTLINGRGRHGKASRGHTKEECDIKMVEMLHKA